VLGSAQEREAHVLDFLERFFGPAAATPQAYVETIWAEEEFSRGCYAGSFTPGGWTTYGPELCAPVGPLHWAGTETARVWNGYIDGAVESGERAAFEVLEGMAIAADRWPAPLPISGGALGTDDDRADIAALAYRPSTADHSPAAGG
jgi:hypothetical protein